MASLLGSLPTLGTVTASSLIKSAATIQNQINTFEDQNQEITFENNPSDDNLQQYLTYLNGRVDTLTSSGSIVDLTKAQNLQQTMRTAVSSNISFNIENESIQVMAGNASPQDKLNYINSAYTQAASIGDTKLAQSLESQSYSLSQTIQNDQATADAATETLAKANAGDEQSVATNLNQSLKQLNNDIQNSGEADMNKTIAAWVKQNTQTLETLGVKIPDGAQPNYFDLVNAVGGAIYNAHVLAYQAELPYDPQTAQTYLNSAVNLRQGVDKLHTLAGDLTAQQVSNAAADPAEYTYNQATSTLEKNQQTGFTGYDADGDPLPSYSGQTQQTIFLTPAETTSMTQLGLSFDNKKATAAEAKNGTTNTGNGVQVTSSENTPAWLQKVLGPNGKTNIFTTPTGLQFEADGQEGGKSFYTVAIDARGLHGVFENLPDGTTRAVGGDYGFNAATNSAVGNLVNEAQQTQHMIALQTAQQAAQLKLSTPAPLPTINIPTAAPAPIVPTTTSIQSPPMTTSIQNANGNPQSNATSTGANINQAPGKGIAITGTTNASVGMKI